MRRDRVCRKCGRRRDILDFHVYKHGPYRAQRRFVCKDCMNERSIAWRGRNGAKRREMVPNTPRLRAMVQRLHDHYGRIDTMCQETGLSKSSYNRIMREERPRVAKDTAVMILKAMQHLTQL